MELNKAVLDCMQSLRRRLREELSVDIRLSQPDAVEAMLLACLRSSDQDTRRLGIRLAELSDSAAAAPAPAHSARQYRGHELPEQQSVPQDNDAEQRGHSVRMYRGQRVYA
jgi:hypothetical protein